MLQKAPSNGHIVNIEQHSSPAGASVSARQSPQGKQQQQVVPPTAAKPSVAAAEKHDQLAKTKVG